MPEAAWYSGQNLKPFGNLYKTEFALPEERTQQEVTSLSTLITSHFPNVKIRVLDIAGGFGRLGRKLLSHPSVKEVVNLDTNHAFLKEAQSAGVLSVRADMRRFPFVQNAFEFSALMFTAFGYFAKSEDDVKVLKESHRTLQTGGLFVLDLPNYDRILTSFDPERTLELPDGRRIEYTKSIEDDILVESRVLKDMTGKKTTLAPIRLRIYPSRNAKALCAKVGFSKVNLFDQALNSFNPSTSRRLWIVCKK